MLPRRGFDRPTFRQHRGDRRIDPQRDLAALPTHDVPGTVLLHGEGVRPGGRAEHRQHSDRNAEER
jgi:hypothetical protein